MPHSPKHPMQLAAGPWDGTSSFICYIKQSNTVLLGLISVLFSDFRHKGTVHSNLPISMKSMTVHESSLSPHIHSFLPPAIGEVKKAYQLLFCTMPPVLTWMITTTKLTKDYISTSMPGQLACQLYEALPTIYSGGPYSLSSQLVRKKNGTVTPFQINYQET